MTPEEITRLFACWRKAWLRGDSATLAASYSDMCILETPTYGRLTGRVAVEKVFRHWFETFPDSSAEFGDFLIMGNHVIQTLTVHGTDTGGFLGQAPTGRRFRLFAVLFFELDDGHIVHDRRVYDVHGLLLQLATGHSLMAETSVDENRTRGWYRATLATARMEQELQIAAEIQRALLPAPHHKGFGFEVAAASSPCRAIGGDFLDYFDLPDGAFGFVLGDVAGKGPPAALLAAKLQGILAAYSKSGLTPSETLTRVNEELVRRTVESRFATMLYGVLSRDGCVGYCNAGHNPPLLVGRRGVQRLERGGLILGAFTNAAFEEETVRLEPDDVLVVFSDGVTEALNTDGAEFGEERLLLSIAANREATPTDVLRHVLAAVQEFSFGAEQSDDLTVLVLRYTGS
jgi:predicted ester cyclase